MVINPYTNDEERKALDMYQDHIRKVITAVKELSLMVEDWINNRWESIEQRLEKISSLEKEADEIKRALLDEVSKAATLIQREDLMRLSLIADEIADYADATSFRLSHLRDWRPQGELADMFREFIEWVVKSVEKLREAIFMLPQNVEKAIKIAEEVDESERKVDVLQRVIVHTLYNLDISAKTLIKVIDFVRHIEEIADIAEDAADAVRIIAVGKLG
jgi:predicted phosphate transport protein (TIGR00153 family)